MNKETRLNHMLFLLHYIVFFYDHVTLLQKIFMIMLPYYVRNDIRNVCQNMIKPFLHSSTGKMGLVATFANILGQKWQFAPASLINIIYIKPQIKKG